MSSNDCVEQKGIIEDITNGIGKVNITSFSACASCSSKSACQMSENTNKIIDVHLTDNNFSKGEIVKVAMKKVLGLRATLIAYVLPFTLIIFSLIILTNIGVSEAVSGIISLALLVPYFLFIYYKRDSLKKTFQFTLDKVD